MKKKKKKRKKKSQNIPGPFAKNLKSSHTRKLLILNSIQKITQKNLMGLPVEHMTSLKRLEEIVWQKAKKTD